MDNIETVLKTLVGIGSYVPYENEPQAYLTTFLESRNFSITKQNLSGGGFNLLAERGEGQHSILFYTHMDTVLPASGYKSESLQLQKTGDKLFGLGCFDMKGGIAALLSVLDSDQFQKHRVKIAFCIDEEGISRGAQALVSSPFIKDVKVAFCPEAAIIPKAWRLPLLIAIGGRGRCVIEITIPGKSAHGAEDSVVINAIDQAAVFIRQLPSFLIKKDPDLGTSSFFVRSIHSDPVELSIPSQVILEIDYQMVVGETVESVKERLRKFISALYRHGILYRSMKDKWSLRPKPRLTPYIAPYKLAKTNKFVQLVERVANSLYSQSAFDYTKSVADQNILANSGIPIITIGPLGGNAHQAGEWVSLSSLNQVAKFYQAVLTNIYLI